MEDGSVVVDLPNLGTQHVFILTELCYHCWGIFGLEIYCNREDCVKGELGGREELSGCKVNE